MNSKLRRFASLGLYLSLLAALVSAGYYIILRQWNLPLQISLALVVLGLAIFAAFDPDRVRSRNYRSSGTLWQQCIGDDYCISRNFSGYKLPGFSI